MPRGDFFDNSGAGERTQRTHSSRQLLPDLCLQNDVLPPGTEMIEGVPNSQGPRGKHWLKVVT